MTSLDRKLGIRLRIDFILIIAVFWCHLLYRVDGTYCTYFSYLVFVAYAVGCFFLYRKYPIDFELSLREGAIGGGFLLAYLTLENQYLFYDLGGDELYHAEYASFILVRINEWVGGWPHTTLDHFRKSIWNLFDLRHFPVVDLWRIVSALLLVGLAVAIRYGSPGVRRWPTTAKVALIVVGGLLIAGYWHHHFLATSMHPPLRLFLPFVTHLFLGYNNFGFRFAGVLVLSLVSFFFYFLLSREGQKPAWWKFIVSLGIGLIPVVFYSAQEMEPSIYGFAVWITSFLLAWLYLEKRDPRDLVLIGVLAGVGPMMRQTIVALWPLMFVLLLVARAWKDRLLALRVLAPLGVSLPYFVIVKLKGHMLITTDETLPQKLLRALKTGLGVMPILNSTTLPWVLFAVLAIVAIARKLKAREAAIFLMFVPAFCVFHDVWSFLWGVGRYQAEYVGAFLALLIFYLGLYCSERRRWFFAVGLAFLAGVTLEVNSNLSMDINYENWGQKRITTSANFPYGEALGYLRRREAQGHFALLGGQPWYGNPVAWLSGHSIAETITWRSHQDRVTDFWGRKPTFQQIQQFLAAEEVRYLVVQEGTRRERQHRSDPSKHVYEMLERETRTGNPGLLKLASFGGQHGGILDVYEITPSGPSSGSARAP